MMAFWDPAQAAHDPAFFLLRGVVQPNFEVPARAHTLLAACRAMGLDVTKPPPAPQAALLQVHAPDYLDFLQNGYAEFCAIPGHGPEIVPNTHCSPEMLVSGARRPSHILGRMGWYIGDTSMPIGPHSWAAAQSAAAAALAAADEAAMGRSAYALCRPPGHHAYPARANGHCMLNNAALAAERLRGSGAARVGILDLDVHHGNGAQYIFWTRDDVVTVSVHGDPDQCYPWHVGYAGERGAGAGQGANLNLPLPRGGDDDLWLRAIDAGLDALDHCDAIVVALGLDASRDEPLGFLSISEDGFARAGTAVGARRKPCAIVQEGGYNLDAIGTLLTRFLTNLAEAQP